MKENQIIYATQWIDGHWDFELYQDGYWWGTLDAEEVGQLMGGN